MLNMRDELLFNNSNYLCIIDVKVQLLTPTKLYYIILQCNYIKFMIIKFRRKEKHDNAMSPYSILHLDP